MRTELKFLLVYLTVLSLIAVAATVYDKLAAKHKAGRIAENTLMYIGVLGGAPAMLLCMQLIRHKTRHKKFMIGLPVIIVIQAAALFAAWRYAFN